MKALQPSAVLLGTAALLSLTLFGACERSPMQPSVATVSAAKGGAKDPKVEATDPSSAEQDTTLDVEVSGSGFDQGSVVDFGRDGEPTPGYIKTNHTRFVGPKKLIANITIADTALVALYDVIVTTSRGKKGIGTEMFQVKEKGGMWDQYTSLIITYDDDEGHKIRSDGHGVHGSTYEDDVCGVYAKFTLNDATMDPDRHPITGKERNACGGRDPRSMTVVFDDPVAGDPGPTWPGGWFMNVDHVESVKVADGTVLRWAQFNTTYCRLQFRPDEAPGSNYVQVTAIDHNTWTVETQADGKDVATCADGRRYHMPFKITVRSLP